MRPHAYMYGKKLDDNEKALPPHSKRMKEPPPQHEFSYRWFRGPLHESCSYEGCPRRASYSPHAWSRHALGGTDCSLQCVSTQSSMFRQIYCNKSCFVNAWKTQYTVKNNNSGAQTTPLRSRSSSMDEVMSDDAESTRSNGSNKSPSFLGNGADPVTPAGGSNTPRGFLSGINNNSAHNFSAHHAGE